MIDPQRIRTVEPPDFYIELANERMERKTRDFRDRSSKRLEPLEKSKAIEIYKVQVHSEHLRNALNDMIHTFPQLVDFSEFYQRLLSLSLDLVKYQNALNAVLDVQERVRALQSLTCKRIKHARSIETINTYRREYTGRAQRMVNALAKHLEYLRHSRGILRQIPIIREMPTVVIAGFPNVGKSTLLGALTGSTPRIAAFPFTTQQLMLGYKNSMQFVDTPGLLDRPQEKRNDIEQHAVIALAHLADVVVFVYDPSETCGYTMKQQERLYEQVKTDLNLPIIIVYNKKDLWKPERQDGILIEAKSGEGVSDVYDAIVELMPKRPERHAIPDDEPSDEHDAEEDDDEETDTADDTDE